MSSTTHRHRYKNVGLDSTELRRRREEEGIQIRKQKREQQLIKRRNVNIPSELEDDTVLQVSVYHPLSFARICDFILYSFF